MLIMPARSGLPLDIMICLASQFSLRPLFAFYRAAMPCRLDDAGYRAGVYGRGVGDRDRIIDVIHAGSSDSMVSEKRLLHVLRAAHATKMPQLELGCSHELPQIATYPSGITIVSKLISGESLRSPQTIVLVLSASCPPLRACVRMRCLARLARGLRRCSRPSNGGMFHGHAI
jgi:hypothetical protein